MSEESRKNWQASVEAARERGKELVEAYSSFPVRGKIQLVATALSEATKLLETALRDQLDAETERRLDVSEAEAEAEAEAELEAWASMVVRSETARKSLEALLREIQA